MWQIGCFKHLEVYLLAELQQETDRSSLSTVPTLRTFLLKGNCSCRRRALVFHWDENCFPALRMQPSVLLCLEGTCPCALSFILFYLFSVGLSLHPFSARRELRKSSLTQREQSAFRFWQSSAFRLVRATMCSKPYSLNKAMLENARNICQMLVKYCYMIVWLISYRSASKSSGAELWGFLYFLFPTSLSFLLSLFSF